MARDLTPTERLDLYAGNCPHCQSKNLSAGPRGGASQNFFCGDCGAGYNRLAPEYTDRLSTVPAFGQLVQPPREPSG